MGWIVVEELYVDEVDVVCPAAEADTVDISVSVIAADAYVVVNVVKFWC